MKLLFFQIIHQIKVKEPNSAIPIQVLMTKSDMKRKDIVLCSFNSTSIVGALRIMDVKNSLRYYTTMMTWNYYFQDSVELIEEYKSNYINILVIQCVTIVY